jgi:hypothetical protein
MSANVGVRSQLGASAKIYYSHHFKARSVGRVSDLIAACLKEKGLDPLQLRGSILYALYIGYCVTKEPLDSTLSLPSFSLEVGFDEEKVVVSLSLHLEGAAIESLKELKDSIERKDYSKKVEKHIFELGVFSQSLELRHFKAANTLEFLFFLGSKVKEEPEIHWREFESISEAEEIDADYIELGDADYLKSLGVYLTGKTDSSGEKISGDAPNGLSSTKVDGKAENVDQSVKVFKNDQKAKEDAVFRVSSGGSSGKSGDSDALNAKINELAQKVSLLEKERDQLKESLAAQKLKSSKPEEGAMGFLKSVWPFKKGEEAPPPEKDSVVVFKGEKDERKNQNDEVLTLKSTKTKKDESSTVIEQEEEEDLKDSDSSQLYSKLKEFSPLKPGSEFKRVLDEMDKGSRSDERMKAWHETLNQEMNSEKARINEIVRELGRQARQRENEFLAKERAAATELRKKEELLRQKETVIQQKSEQLAQANVNMERLKSSSAGNEEQGLKLKLSNAQKLSQMKEEENKALVKKMRDLENKVMVAQSKSSSGVDTQMVAKLATAEKRVEEYKRMNQRLTDSLQKSQEKRGDQDDSESRRKLENSERILGETKKNLEKVSLKLKEVQDSERKSQVEIGKLQEENKKLKQTISRSGAPPDDKAA